MFGEVERITGNAFLVEVEKRDAATYIIIVMNEERIAGSIQCQAAITSTKR